MINKKSADPGHAMRQFTKAPLALALVCCAFVSSAGQATASGKTAQTENIEVLSGTLTPVAEDKKLYILDGYTVTPEVANSVDPKRIESVKVLDAATAVPLYGSDAKYGAVVITSKP